MAQTWLWVAFNIFVLGMLAIDLGVFNRKAHIISVKEAARWTAVVVAAALIFNAGIFWLEGPTRGLEFTTGYLIELALSVDNIFVFILIFAYFKVPPIFQHRVLFWGIFGALLMRGAMIAGGAFLIERFHWIIYIFGAFLVFTGIRMAMQDEMDIEPESNPVLKLVRRFFPISPNYDGQKFFTEMTIGGVTRKAVTPLFVVLLLVETTDLIFAVDSIPAVFAVTTDPFLVYTSNVFAILGLRSMYFLLAGVIDKFHYLQLGLSAVLVFIGVKMLVTFFDIHVPIAVSLGVVGGVLAISVVASLMFPKKLEEKSPVDPEDENVLPGS
ncbi:MAG TPA: TerC family protein [Longimicrobiaceae bacterium]|nr:TerC family protein [Longimicrobiaceae bacterium]